MKDISVYPDWYLGVKVERHTNFAPPVAQVTIRNQYEASGPRDLTLSAQECQAVFDYLKQEGIVQ